MLFTLRFYITWTAPFPSTTVATVPDEVPQASMYTSQERSPVPVSSNVHSVLHPSVTMDLPPVVIWSRSFEGFVDDELDEDEYE